MEKVKVGFYYEVSPLAALAHDGQGNDAKTYMEINIELQKQPSEADYQKLQESAKQVVFESIGMNADHLRSISKEEYDANQEEEED